jgi:hypothetical protein
MSKHGLMIHSGLSGPFRLTYDGIEGAVKRRSPGVYALGYAAPDGKFFVNSIGRCDMDLRARLREHIGSAMLFKYDYFPSPRAAFERECELFHDLRPPGNRIHPDRPKGTTLDCPRCRIFGQRS